VSSSIDDNDTMEVDQDVVGTAPTAPIGMDNMPAADEDLASGGNDPTANKPTADDAPASGSQDPDTTNAGK
jgi:hypothetical protein